MKLVDRLAIKNVRISTWVDMKLLQNEKKTQQDSVVDVDGYYRRYKSIT